MYTYIKELQERRKTKMTLIELRELVKKEGLLYYIHNDFDLNEIDDKSVKDIIEEILYYVEKFDNILDERIEEETRTDNDYLLSEEL